LHHILENVLLQGTIDSIKCSRQDMIFLKLDFSKEYDKISWNFLFDVLKKFGMALEYVDMIHIIFMNVKSYVNGSKSPPFQIQCKVR
jgi:hypothetical protein